MRRLICYLFHWWKGPRGYEFNDKYPRFQKYGSEQHRYIRTCANCGEEQLSRVDALRTPYWETVTSADRLRWWKDKENAEFEAKYGNLRGEA